MSQKILIIDDDEGDRRLVEVALLDIDKDFEIIMAETGEKGVEKARDSQADVIVLDTNLTGIDGFETCKRIKELDNCKAKVIITTGVVDAVDAVKARRHGADDYCAKSADCEDLIQIVKEMAGIALDND